MDVQQYVSLHMEKKVSLFVCRYEIYKKQFDV